MFKKILIANRGEIACRIIATARRMGVASVAVYSEADREALHVAMADEAVLVGPALSLDSYLRADRIIEAALKTGADAIHPGYGFLSENPEFVEAVEAAGLTFIGPSADAMRAMGLKDKAKQLMIEAGVPVVPGYQGDEQDPAFLAEQADGIGYPVLIKARAGGGGKGMRLVERAEDFGEALASAQREAAASFGDAQCLIEKFIQRPRHIEVQVFGDKHGQVVHLFERDCSMQRRHQKIIEEAPAPGLSDELRQAMGQAAVRAAEAIDYSGAGTIEFIVDSAGGLRADGFWFMEMNTRLQVEHPVTEAITGLDLVEWQLRVAAGEPLPLSQDSIPRQGHAIEARICAEDASRGFVPAIGHLSNWDLPGAIAFNRASLRIDAGVRSGQTISPYYDPMIAKIITHAPTRAQALSALAESLAGLKAEGLTTNADFLRRLLISSDFEAAELDTGLVERELDSLIQAPEVAPALVILAALVLSGALQGREPAAQSSADPWLRLSHWRALCTARLRVPLLAEAGQGHEVSLVISGAHNLSVTAQIDGGDWQTLNVGSEQEDDRQWLTFEQDGHVRRLAVSREGAGVALRYGAQVYRFEPQPGWQDEAQASAGDSVIAPMPGLVQKVLVGAGQQVSEGQALLILEAMKMEHTLKAPRDGKLAVVGAVAGAQVSDGQILIELEPEGEAG